MAINRDKVEAAAIKLLQQGKYDKAIAELKKLVEDDKNDVRTLLKLGDTWVKVGNKKESIESYERAATIYTEQGFFLKAVAVYKQILRVDAAIPELHLKLAELYQQLGLTSDALQHYQNVAVFYEQQGKPRDALDMLKRMVDLDPDNIASRIKLGQLFAKEGLVGEARQELQNALSFLKAQQRFDDYVRVGENLVQYDPGATDVARELAVIYMQRQQPSVALGKLQLCFKSDPRNVEILAMIAQAFLDMQQVGKTVSVFKEMAKIYSTDGKADLAQSTWERVLTLAPGDAEAEEALGRGARPTMVPTMAPGAAGAPLAVATTTPPNRPNPEDEQLARLLTETDVYVKYGLKEKAIEHLQKVFALRPEYLPALEKLKNLQQAIGGRELGDTLRRLVSVAESQGHPRVDEWRGELARVAARPAPAPAPAPAARANYSTSGEGEVILVDDPPADEPPLDEPILEDPSGVMRLDDEASGIVPLDSSQLDEPFISSEGEIATLPPDEDLDPAAAVAPQIPRMPTGVMRAPPQPAPAPMFSPDEPLGKTAPLAPLESGEPIDADALVRQALQDMRAEDVEAAADELLLEAMPADMPPVPQTGPLPVRAPPPPADDVGGDAAEFGEEEAFGGDDEGELPTMALPMSQLSSSAASQVGFEDHPSLLTGPGTASLAVTTAQGGPMVTSPTMSVPGNIDDDEIDRLAREAVLDADRKLGDVIEATAVLSPSPEEMDELHSLPADDGGVLPAEMDDGNAFEERTVALIGGHSSDMPTDERPKHGAVPAGRAASPMADGFSDAEDHVVTGSGHGEPLSARAAPAGVNGFEGEVSEEFDPSSFDLPADVKELLRAQSSGVPAAEPASAVLAPPAGSEPDEAPIDEPAQEEPRAAAGSAGKLGVADKAHGWEGDPANQFFPDELEESEFFIQQDLLDEAKEILTAILDDVPDSGRVQWMLARIEAKENGQPEPPAPWEQKLEEQILEEVQAHLQGLGFDNDDAPKPFGDATAQVSVDEVLSQFKKGIAETVPEEDAATHYELGIAYREMGLHDDAVAEFHIASRAPARAADARFLIGLVRRDQGQLDAAVKAFDEALSLPTATRDQRGAAEYERGVCLEDLGRMGEALHAYKAARAHGSAAVDLDRRMRALTEKVGEGGRGPKNIDYV